MRGRNIEPGHGLQPTYFTGRGGKHFTTYACSCGKADYGEVSRAQARKAHDAHKYQLRIEWQARTGFDPTGGFG